MRNLKRALSLTLASVMLLGMMVVGAGAASYPDVDESNNIEAIEVLQAVKVMEGDSAGNFDPDRPVSRAEMAVIMALLLNLDYDYYRGTKTFSDVPNWCAPYVAACYANGIISGYNATTYGSADTVNAVQAASMVMRALGYFKYSEDYEGDFVLSTVKQASRISLFKGINANSMDPLTRNQVAQLALNALRSDMVDFTGDVGFEVNGVKVGYRAEYTPRTSTEPKYRAITGLTTTLNTNNQYYVQLGEQLYDGDLRLIDTAADDFDRPSRTWEYNGKAIGTYAKKELLNQEYTVGVTGKNLYDLLSAATIKEYDVTYYVDGKVDETIKNSNMIRTNTKEYDTTGKGVLTQVYVDNNKKEITIVSIHTYLAQATADYNAKKGTVSLNVFKDDSTGTAKTVDVEVVPGIEDIKKDDYVLVNWAEIGNKSGTYGKMEVVKVSEPEVMTDVKLNKYSKESYVVNNGTQYDYGKDGVQKNDLGEYKNDLLKDYTYNLYLDQYGYLSGVVKFSGQDHYLFLVGYDRPKSNLSMSTADAAVIFLDGTMQTVKVNVTETDKKLTKDGSGNPNVGGTDANVVDATNYPVLKKATDGRPQYNKWFKYTTKGEGDNAVYTLTPVGGDRWMDVAATSFATRGINTASVRLTSTAPNKKTYAWGNDDSVFITVEAKNNAVDGNVTYGTAAITKVKDIYTGMDDTDLEVQDSAVVATYFTNSVFAVFDEDHYIIGAVVVGDAKNSNKDYAYAIKEAKAEWIEGDYTYWVFEAVVNGEIKELTVKDEYDSTIDAIKAVVGTDHINKSGLMKLTYDKDGYVVDVETYASQNNTAESAESPANKVYENGDYKTSIDVDPDKFNAYNLTFGTGYEKKLTGDGRTLYISDTDAGLRLAKDAPVIVVQVEEDSKGNQSIVYDSYSNLLSARQDLVSDTAYKGWISAVIGDKGAEYIVLKENTVKGLETDDGSHDNDGLPQNREELKLTKEDMNDIETKGPVGNEDAFEGIGPFLQQGLNYDYDDVTGVLTISGKITKAYGSDDETNVPGFGTPKNMLTSKQSKYVTFIPIPVGDSWMLWAVSSLTKADTTVSANHGGNGNKAFTITWDLDWSKFGKDNSELSQNP